MNKKILRMVQLAMLAAVSIVLLYLIRVPLIPSAPFLEYDMADVPVLIASLLFGPASGMITLLVVCLIQALTVSAASGWIGFVMHFLASSALLLVAAIIYQKGKKSVKLLIIGLVCGSLAMTVVMIPLNLVFTGIFMGNGAGEVAKMLIPAIIPFNLLKAGINSVLTFIVFLPLKRVLQRYI